MYYWLFGVLVDKAKIETYLPGTKWVDINPNKPLVKEESL